MMGEPVWKSRLATRDVVSRNEDLRKIFEPFYTTRDVGTGLGLAVVSRILEGYQGSIDIQSEAGSGTTCRIWFPAQILTADGNRTIS